MISVIVEKKKKILGTRCPNQDLLTENTFEKNYNRVTLLSPLKVSRQVCERQRVLPMAYWRMYGSPWMAL
jgi:hypothetical protein